MQFMYLYRMCTINLKTGAVFSFSLFFFWGGESTLGVAHS